MRRIEIQGHRGARGLWPENTAEGFRRTVALGVDSIETDVAITADGVAVLSHDPVLDPDLTHSPAGWLTRPSPAIAGLTLAQLRRYEVGCLRPGSKLAARFPRQAVFAAAAIPTLAEGFAASAPVVLDVELKTFPDGKHPSATPEAMVDLVLATAAASGALARLAVRSFDWRGLRYLRAHHPAIPYAVLTSPDTSNATWWDGVAPGASVAATVAAFAGAGATWAPEWQSLDEAAIADAHARGLRVVPWTVNDPAAMRRLLDWGCDGLCSDEPDLALAVRQALNL